MHKELIEVSIRARSFSVAELKQLLGKYGVVNFSEPGIRVRGIDTAVLVAIVSTTSAALGAFVSGLLQIVREKKAAKIELQDKDGRRIVMPADTPAETIPSFVAHIKAMETPRVIID
jgi:alpha-galactosidase